ncbi:MAG: ATP-binding protein [Flavobacteriaceae bacterium]
MGGIVLEKAKFNLRKEIEYVNKAFNIQTITSKNTFSFSIEHQIPDTIIGDITRYKQIIYNLLGNANKFTSNGEISLNISIVEKTESSILLLTQVKDNGIGMDNHEQEELFKPFSQSNQSITRKYGGSGLGLTIAKKLSQVMGGDIQLKSEKGKGSCFRFTILFGL